MTPIRVAVVEDDARYRSSLEQLFELSPGFTLDGAFGNGEAALEAAEKHTRAGRQPPWDVVLMDIDLPKINGLMVTQKLKQLCPSIPVVVLTVFEEPDVVLDAISAGADGYLLKRTEAPLILKQLQEIGAGGSPLTASVARKVLDMLRDSAVGRPEPRAVERMGLSDREQEVLRCLVEGCGYKETAARLNVSLDTVRSHIRSIYKKLQVSSSSQAISKAIRRRLV